MKISVLAANAMLDALCTLPDAGSPPGHIYIRTGAAPTNTTDADSGTLLATLTLANDSFAAASSNTATAAAITQDSSTTNSGTAAHFRLKNAAGTTIWQGTVGAGSGDISLNSTTFAAGGTCAISSFVVTQPLT